MNRKPKVKESDAYEQQELATLYRECDWVLKEEVPLVIEELFAVLVEARRSFPSQIYPSDVQDTIGNPEKYIVSNTNGPQQIKCVLTLFGATISEAEIVVKMQKTQVPSTQLRINPEEPWRLQQVQDAENQLLCALGIVDTFTEMSQQSPPSTQRVLKLLEEVSQCINRGRSSLAMPRRKTLPELLTSSNTSCIKPPLPNDLAVSFYIQAHKLVLSAYSLNNNDKTDISSRVQADCTVPWLNDVLVLFTLALQLCQQLTDKISVLSPYESGNKEAEGSPVHQQLTT